jgi:tetratricopeptide (TPR) repeat protein
MSSVVSPSGMDNQNQTARRAKWMAVAGVLLSAALLVAGIAAYRGLSAQTTAPEREIEPPVLNLAGVDHQIVAAIEEAVAALRKSRRSGKAWGRLGCLLFVHQLPEQAIVCLAQAERLEPENPRWPYFHGVLLETEKPDPAIAKLRRAVELCGDVPDAPRLRLAELLLRQGFVGEAEEQFRCSLGHNPKNARAHLGLGRLKRSSQPEESLRHLALAMDDPSSRKESLILAAAIHSQLGQRAVAEKEYRRATALPKAVAWHDPFLNDALRLRTGQSATLELVNALVTQGQVSEVVPLLHQLVKDYPKSDLSWLALGRALLWQQDTAGAEQALRAGLQLAPHAVDLHFELGLALGAKHDHRGAAACFRKITELKPHHAVAHYNLGLCLRDCGDPDAISALRTAVRCDLQTPYLAEAHFQLAKLLAEKGEHADSRLHARKALDLKKTETAGQVGQ